MKLRYKIRNAFRKLGTGFQAMSLVLQKRDEIEAVANKINEAEVPVENEDWRVKFAIYWPVINIGLELAASLIPGKKDDRIINTLQLVGDKLATGTSSEEEDETFIQYGKQYWPFVRIALAIVMTFTNDKVDKAINKVIDYFDLVLSSESEEAED